MMMMMGLQRFNARVWIACILLIIIINDAIINMHLSPLNHAIIQHHISLNHRSGWLIIIIIMISIPILVIDHDDDLSDSWCDPVHPTESHHYRSLSLSYTANTKFNFYLSTDSTLSHSQYSQDSTSNTAPSHHPYKHSIDMVHYL